MTTKTMTTRTAIQREAVRMKQPMLDQFKTRPNQQTQAYPNPQRFQTNSRYPAFLPSLPIPHKCDL
jgi:hypothetical protein